MGLRVMVKIRERPDGYRSEHPRDSRDPGGESS